jgi:hypothetical protein
MQIGRRLSLIAVNRLNGRPNSSYPRHGLPFSRQNEHRTAVSGRRGRRRAAGGFRMETPKAEQAWSRPGAKRSPNSSCSLATAFRAFMHLDTPTKCGATVSSKKPMADSELLTGVKKVSAATWGRLELRRRMSFLRVARTIGSVPSRRGRRRYRLQGPRYARVEASARRTICARGKDTGPEPQRVHAHGQLGELETILR